MSHNSIALLNETIGTGEIVPIIGAGIHALSGGVKHSNLEWKASREILNNWDALLLEAAKCFQLKDENVVRVKLSPTLKWELIVNNIVGQEPASVKERYFIDCITKVAKEAEQKIISDLIPYHPLTTILKHRSIRNIVSLNIEFLVEQLLLENNDQYKVKGKSSIDRKTLIDNKTVWHPHGDYKNKQTITFGLRHYSKVLKNVESARKRYKQYEFLETEPVINTWIDLFMSKSLLFIGTSVDNAEWDIWFALINRWRNFGHDKNNDLEPPVFVLSKTGSHVHLPNQKFHLINGNSYPESWEILRKAFQ